MVISLDIKQLKDYLNMQLYHFFPDKKDSLDFKDEKVCAALEDAIYRLEYCFSKISISGYNINNEPFFNHLHMDQYSQFLYWLSNSLWEKQQNLDVCSRLVILNRALSGCWFSFKANLPDIFLLIHPVGTVIGHKGVTFSDYLVVLQNVTIESVEGYGDELYIGKCCFLGANTRVLRGGHIGDRVSLGANVTVRKPQIDNDCTLYMDNTTGRVEKRLLGGSCAAQRYFIDNLTKV